MAPPNDGEFSLSLADRAVTGIKVDGSKRTLVIRPTASAIAAGVLYLVLGLSAIVVATAIHGVLWVVWPIGLAALLCGWRLAMARVIATSTELKIRNHWRSYTVEWSSITTISQRVVPKAWSRLPLSPLLSWPSSEKLNEVTIATPERDIVPDALASSAGSHFGDRSPTEVKLDVLARWRSEVIPK